MTFAWECFANQSATTIIKTVVTTEKACIFERRRYPRERIPRQYAVHRRSQKKSRRFYARQETYIRIHDAPLAAKMSKVPSDQAQRVLCLIMTRDNTDTD